MIISKKKYNELVEARDFWRNRAFEMAITNDRLCEMLKQHFGNTEKIIDKCLNKEKQNDQT